jgi:hypothetical protein
VTFTHSKNAAQAVEIAGGCVTRQDALAAIVKSTTFELGVVLEDDPPEPTLTGVLGWTYGGLYPTGDDSDPFLMVAGEALDSGKVTEWVTNAHHTSIQIWLNNTLIKDDVAKAAATLVHELELHAFALYDLHSQLLAAQVAGAGDTRNGIVATIRSDIAAGRYLATGQHESAALRANQVSAILGYLCAAQFAVTRPGGSGGSKRKEVVPEGLDPDSLEYKVMMATRQDVAGDGEIPDGIKAGYAATIVRLGKLYGEGLVVQTVEDFETT